MDWSRYGRLILYEEDTAPGNQRSLRILPAAPGDAKPRHYLRAAFNQSYGQFSPDTRWVAFQSDESGRYEVYIDTFPEPGGKCGFQLGEASFRNGASAGASYFTYRRILCSCQSVSSREPDPWSPRRHTRCSHLHVIDADVSPYDAAPDGQRFLVLETAEHAVQPLTAIVNWPALLTKSANSQ